MVIYGDDDNFTKFGRIATNASGSAFAEKFEYIYENNGTARNDAADSTANLAASFPKDYYLRITSDGTNITGAYSTDGNAWTTVGRAAPLPGERQDRPVRVQQRRRGQPRRRVRLVHPHR